METNSSDITLKPGSLIRDIQFKFNSLYPFLKIEFCKNGGISNGKKAILNSEYCLKDISELSSNTILNVDKNRTIEYLALDSIDKLGLSIQVFRKSGNVWNVISLTDNWTLENQNNAGQFISAEMTRVSTLPVAVV